jgi:hypothetical protein
MRLSTPWGDAQTIKTLAPGILLVSTASHGGLMLDSAALLDLPEHLRNAGETYGDWRCFEEDCACGLVYEARIDLYRENKRQQLASWEKTLGEPNPPAWAAQEGPACVERLRSAIAMSDADLLAPIAADNRRWFPEVFGLRPNCGHCYGQHPPLPEGTLVVCAAFGGGAVGVPSGFVGVSAKVGCHAAVTPEDKKERLFLVPEEDYDKRDEGCFVVDPERHAVWEHQNAALVQ